MSTHTWMWQARLNFCLRAEVGVSVKGQIYQEGFGFRMSTILTTELFSWVWEAAIGRYYSNKQVDWLSEC